MKIERVMLDDQAYVDAYIADENKVKNEVNGYEEISIFKDGVTL